MTSVARARYRLQIAWNAYNAGLLSFDRSTFDGTDVFGVSPMDVSFGGTYDDVSSRLDRASWGRGRDDNLALMLAGEATFDLRDPGYMSGGVWKQGLYNPENPDSPLFAQLADRLHPVRFEGIFGGVTYGLFAGWGRRFVWEPHGRRGTVQVECVDLFYWLARVFPVIAAGGTTTGAAIGSILDAAGLTDTAMRDLDVGDTLPATFTADGSRSGLELIQALLEAERGVFFVAGTGRATYRSRLSRLTKTSSWTLTDRMIGVAPGLDFDQAKTRVTVTRVDAAGVELYSAVSTSTAPFVGRIGLSDLPEIRTLYLVSNAQADQLASWIRSQVESPRAPVYGFDLDNRDADILTQILSRELVDRITATESAGGTTGDFHVDRMTHSLEMGGAIGGRHRVTWLLSKASAISPAVFDVATFDAGATFVY